MNAFDLLRPRDIETATKALKGESPPVVKAGGMDLLDRMKEGIDRPAALLDIQKIDSLRGIDATQSSLTIGALATLAEIAASEAVRKQARALAEAAGEAATPQVRSVATLGGNLLQRSRCWYYRSSDFEPCLKRGGKECFAKEGRNKIHAIFGTEAPCVAVHPSSLAPALVALDATVGVVREKTLVTKPIADVFVDGTTCDRDHALAPDELLASVSIPLGRRSAYREFQERATYDWALASCAVSFVWRDGVCAEPRIVLGAVAHRPVRREAAEAHLAGKKLTPELAREVAAKALEGAKPLAENGYKIQIARALVMRALLAAAGMEAGK
ncbi:FAD binding domain-containing protein [bacterium]|nr:FAD binding domain-containing protein [bacterium]